MCLYGEIWCFFVFVFRKRDRCISVAKSEAPGENGGKDKIIDRFDRVSTILLTRDFAPIQSIQLVGTSN